MAEITDDMKKKKLKEYYERIEAALNLSNQQTSTADNLRQALRNRARRS